jgi:RNA polymerase sigma-70 factor (ECF subfamily)
MKGEVPPLCDANARFCTTHWSVVMKAGAIGKEQADAREQFCRTYWYPLYSFARRQGHTAEDARDLVQELFAQMLESQWLAQVEQRTTRFSTLLLTIFQRLIASERRRATADKRGGGALPISIDLAEAESWFGEEPNTQESPERIFERSWALAVLAAAIERLRQICHAAGRDRQFELLSPLLSREPEVGEYEKIAVELGMNPRTVAVNVHRLRAQYRECVREEVAAGLNDPMRVDEELAFLAAAV